MMAGAGGAMRATVARDSHPVSTTAVRGQLSSCFDLASKRIIALLGSNCLARNKGPMSLMGNCRHHATKDPPPIREAAFASLKARLRQVRAPVDPMDASEGREASGRRRILQYDSRKTTARPARSS